MDGRILKLTSRRLMMFKTTLEVTGGVPHDELPKADRILDKLVREGDVGEDVVEVVLTNEEYDWLIRRWTAHQNFSLIPEMRKHILAISDALRDAPGFHLKSSDGSVTVERERDPDAVANRTAASNSGT